MKCVRLHITLHPNYPFRVHITKITVFQNVRPLLGVNS